MDEQEIIDENENNTDNESPKPNGNSSTIHGIFDFVETLAYVFVFIIFATMFLFKNTIVQQTSMMNTLENGDRVIITNIFFTPNQGDIIVFQDPVTGTDNALVKRVIATEGQTVTYIDGVVTVDGVTLEEDYVFCDKTDYHESVTCTVPEGMVFVMGDHRNVSHDSRNFGCISEHCIIGKAIFRIAPISKMGFIN